MIWILLIIALVIFIFFIVQPYRLRYDTICSFTGGLGSGKTLLSVDTAIFLWKRNVRKTKLYNFFHRKNKIDMPLLYTSIPVRIDKKHYSNVLTVDMLLLQTRVVPGSVVLLDEVDVFANQWQLANGNIIDIPNKKDLEAKREGKQEFDTGLFDESIRLWRHMNSSKCCEPYFITNSQATSNISTIIRRRMNVVFVLANKRFFWLPFGYRLFMVDCRNIVITDEITNTNDFNAEDHTKKLFRIVGRFRRYDTHCYSSRAATIPIDDRYVWYDLKTNRLLRCPYDRMTSKADNSFTPFQQ